jgi:hypothetical protein
MVEGGFGLGIAEPEVVGLPILLKVDHLEADRLAALVLE